MSIFNFFKKKNNFNDFVYDKRTYSTLSLGPFVNAFPEYADFEEDQNMKVWDSIIPILLVGYETIRGKIDIDKTKFSDLKTEINKQFHKGSDMLLEDYLHFVKSQSIQSDDISKYSAFWLSKNLQLYVSKNLKPKLEDKKFLDIFSIYLKTTFNDSELNYNKFIASNFRGSMKSQEGMLEFVTLTEEFLKNLFSSIKSRL